MKKVFGFSVVIITFLLILPLTVLGQPSIPTEETVKIEAVTPAKSFKILNTETNEISEILYDDYIFGVVAAEMPALYEIEALKAQAVAAHTFALHRRVTNSDKGYDITNDFTQDQAFITEAAAREKWGENADEYIEKIKTAVNDTKNLALTYNGEIALSVYHAISFGKTEDCQNVWGGSRPYLTSVSSIGDKLSPNYISNKTVTLAEFKSVFSELTLSDNIADYFKNIVKTDAGTVKALTVCGNEIKGSEIRKKLDLQSACFEVKYENDAFQFTVYGYGHGVGMSQNGANYMAQQGADFSEILCHYYQGCKIEEIK
ncbi:MAG: stage II sporulation protein D [Clostridia bacterium]|nr:stage II sporulation protein D [Clostridia bacterium]